MSILFRVATEQKLVFTGQLRIRERIKFLEVVFHILHRVVKPVRVDTHTQGLLVIGFTLRTVRGKTARLVDIIAEVLVDVGLRLLLLDVGVAVVRFGCSDGVRPALRAFENQVVRAPVFRLKDLARKVLAAIRLANIFSIF